MDLPQTSWGVDRRALLQPCTFEVRDSAACEPSGSGSVRALAAIPLISQRWVPSHACWLVPPGPGAALMDAFHPADVMAYGAEDMDKPALEIQPVDEAGLQAILPAASQVDGLSMPRQEAHRSLEADQKATHERVIAEHVARVDAYNRQLNVPFTLAVQL